MIIPFLGEEIEAHPIPCSRCTAPIAYTANEKLYTGGQTGTKVSNMVKDDDGTWRHGICP